MSVSDLSSPSEFDGVSFTISPSISKARWASFALGKLREGYALVQSPNGVSYQFHRAGEPLQPCPAHAAKKLAMMGLLTIEKIDARGTRYILRPAFLPDGAEA